MGTMVNRKMPYQKPGLEVLQKSGQNDGIDFWSAIMTPECALHFAPDYHYLPKERP